MAAAFSKPYLSPWAEGNLIKHKFIFTLPPQLTINTMLGVRADTLTFLKLTYCTLSPK
jgi:hypothetical protein